MATLSRRQAYEAFMQDQALTFPQIKTPLGEGAGLPAFIDTFEKHGGWITQEELWWHYYGDNRDELLAEGKASALPGIMARAYRTYPSLVREQHLYYLLREGGFDYVSRDIDLDKQGVDYLIVQDGRAYGVAAYYGTERSKSFRAIKKSSHKQIGTVIELPLEPEQARRIGVFDTYTEQHIASIKDQVLSRNSHYKDTDDR